MDYVNQYKDYSAEQRAEISAYLEEKYQEAFLVIANEVLAELYEKEDIDIPEDKRDELLKEIFKLVNSKENALILGEIRRRELLEEQTLNPKKARANRVARASKDPRELPPANHIPLDIKAPGVASSLAVVREKNAVIAEEKAEVGGASIQYENGLKNLDGYASRVNEELFYTKPSYKNIKIGAIRKILEGITGSLPTEEIKKQVRAKKATGVVTHTPLVKKVPLTPAQQAALTALNGRNKMRENLKQSINTADTQLIENKKTAIDTIFTETEVSLTARDKVAPLPPVPGDPFPTITIQQLAEEIEKLIGDPVNPVARSAEDDAKLLRLEARFKAFSARLALAAGNEIATFGPDLTGQFDGFGKAIIALKAQSVEAGEEALNDEVDTLLKARVADKTIIPNATATLNTYKDNYLKDLETAITQRKADVATALANLDAEKSRAGRDKARADLTAQAQQILIDFNADIAKGAALVDIYVELKSDMHSLPKKGVGDYVYQRTVLADGKDDDVKAYESSIIDIKNKMLEITGPADKPNILSAEDAEALGRLQIRFGILKENIVKFVTQLHEEAKAKFGKSLERRERRVNRLKGKGDAEEEALTAAAIAEVERCKTEFDGLYPSPDDLPGVKAVLALENEYKAALGAAVDATNAERNRPKTADELRAEIEVLEDGIDVVDIKTIADCNAKATNILRKAKSKKEALKVKIDVKGKEKHALGHYSHVMGRHYNHYFKEQEKIIALREKLLALLLKESQDEYDVNIAPINTELIALNTSVTEKKDQIKTIQPSLNARNDIVEAKKKENDAAQTVLTNLLAKDEKEVTEEEKGVAQINVLVTKLELAVAKERAVEASLNIANAELLKVYAEIERQKKIVEKKHIDALFAQRNLKAYTEMATGIIPLSRYTEMLDDAKKEHNFASEAHFSVSGLKDKVHSKHSPTDTLAKKEQQAEQEAIDELTRLENLAGSLAKGRNTIEKLRTDLQKNVADAQAEINSLKEDLRVRAEAELARIAAEKKKADDDRAEQARKDAEKKKADDLADARSLIHGVPFDFDPKTIIKTAPKTAGRYSSDLHRDLSDVPTLPRDKKTIQDALKIAHLGIPNSRTLELIFDPENPDVVYAEVVSLDKDQSGFYFRKFVFDGKNFKQEGPTDEQDPYKTTDLEAEIYRLRQNKNESYISDVGLEMANYLQKTRDQQAILDIDVADETPQQKSVREKAVERAINQLDKRNPRPVQFNGSIVQGLPKNELNDAVDYVFVTGNQEIGLLHQQSVMAEYEIQLKQGIAQVTGAAPKFGDGMSEPFFSIRSAFDRALGTAVKQGERIAWIETSKTGNDFGLIPLKTVELKRTRTYEDEPDGPTTHTPPKKFKKPEFRRSGSSDDGDGDDDDRTRGTKRTRTSSGGSKGHDDEDKGPDDDGKGPDDDKPRKGGIPFMRTGKSTTTEGPSLEDLRARAGDDYVSRLEARRKAREGGEHHI
jgi:hypothetical protein